MTFDSIQQFWSVQDRTTVLKRAALMAIGGIILGTITPYDTSNITSVFGRYLYWVGCVVVPALYAGAIGQLVFPFMRGRVHNLVAVVLLYTSAFTLPTFVWVAIWEMILKGVFTYDGRFIDFVRMSLSEMEFTLWQYVGFYMRVWVITLVLVGPISLYVGRGQKQLLAEAADEGKQSPFLDRLPAELGRDLLCLSMEDHYVRAHTRLGDTLILMRMADAVRELATYPGAQVHRSWWVASDAVTALKREQRKVLLELKNGLDVPVSQRRMKELKETGFI